MKRRTASIVAVSAVLGAIVLGTMLWRGAPESVAGEDVPVGDVALEPEDVLVGDVTAEALTAFAVLCSRRHETTPSMIHVAMADPSIMQEEVDDAWAAVDRWCVTGEESNQEAMEVVRRLDSIRARIMDIEGSACGPEFRINWPYHLDRMNAAGDFKQVQRHIRAMERSLSYYEHLEAGICGLRSEMEENEKKLDERRRFTGSVHFRHALEAVIGHPPEISEICKAVSSKRQWRGFPVSDCPRRLHYFNSPNRTWLAVQSFYHLRNLMHGNYGRNRSEPVSQLGQIHSQVCVNRFSFTPVVQDEGAIAEHAHSNVEPLAQAIFTGELLGWHDMEDLDKGYYRLLFERIVGAVSSTNANICANDIEMVTMRVASRRAEAAGRRPADRAGRRPADRESRNRRPRSTRRRGTRRWTPQSMDGGAILWSIADDVIGRIHMDEQEKIETQAQQRFFQNYDRVIYVGRGLEDRVMLDRIFRLEYEPEFSPEEIGHAGTVEMDGLFAELHAELHATYDEMVEREKDRDFERWEAQLNADTQIGVEAARARADIEEAKIEAAVRRYEANMNYKTELAKIRAQERARPGFFSKLLGAAAGVLGGDVARGVVDLVVPKPPAPPPGGTVERTTKAPAGRTMSGG